MTQTALAPQQCVIDLLEEVRIEPAPWLGPDVLVLDLTGLETGAFKVVPAMAAVLEAVRRGAR
jgi:hypothetical protein